MNTKQLTYLFFSFLTLVAGYAFLRYAYKVTDSTPFTQEIVLIILGTVATIFITALLLNKQTSVEIEKEQNIKLFELKTTTYEKLLDLLEEMSLVEDFSEAELVNLQFITHRLAIIASPAVLNEYQTFLDVIHELSKDNSFSGDTIALHQAISMLTLKIREDLIGEHFSVAYSKSQVDEIIKNNSQQSMRVNRR